MTHTNESEPERQDKLVGIQDSHRALYDRVETSLSFTFAALQRALVELQLQLQSKCRQLKEQQEAILHTQNPSPGMVNEYVANMKKIDRSLELFTLHAGNLNVVKFTLARAAAFVSADGALAQLVTVPPERPHCLWVPKAQSQYNTWQSNHDQLQGFGSLESSPRWESERNLRLHQEFPVNRGPSSTCFVFYLPSSATDQTLKQLFLRHGNVLNAHIAVDKSTNRPRGFGFVDFATAAEAQAAVAALDGYPLEGKHLSVSIKV